MIKKLSLIVLIFSLVGVFIIYRIGSAFVEIYVQSAKEGTEAVDFVISEGESVLTIANHLEEQGIINNVRNFRTYVWLSKNDSKFQAGTFNLVPGTSYDEIVHDLTTIQTNEVTITIPEGWTAKQIGAYLENKGLVSATQWNEITKNDEGYLFPDTYRVFTEASADEIRFKLLDTFDLKVTDEMKAEIDHQGKTLEDIVIMASIIEREVRGEKDQKLVSGIFWNRIKIGMALQADSTVNYITGKDTPAISLADRDIDNPYNTYQYRGLPPGPISNPGLGAIQAAIYPEDSSYLYFLTDEEGNVHYASTLDEHVKNKNRYLR